ncbi:MAG: VCBS repeat-containing protein [Candidatus Zixiibacteriota bacterium]|nr:MAG: VCBS repeat-containing protein [candidate division Zixibacteria bacterium]
MHLQKKRFKIKHWWHWIVGLVALLWVLLRSGTNPKRLAYPCQLAAMPVAVNWLLAVVAFFGGSIFLRRYAKFCGAAILIVGVVWFTGALPEYTRSQVTSLSSLPVWEVNDPVSTVFVMDSLPPTSGSLAAGDASVPDEYLPDPAIDTMLLMMEKEDIYLHQTAEHPSGVVGSDNVVIIKGNFQWTTRNTTSTDRIKGVIWQILNHPDGFSGEILVCDNVQDIGTGINQQDNNSEDTAQSIPDVVNTFYAKGYPAYYLDWSYIWDAVASEYSEGDYDDGYVYETATMISYPKFLSPSNNYYISTRYGVWDSLSAQYDSARLCIIDFPVLKEHMMAGSTIAVKNWIGLLTTAYANERYGSWNNMHYVYFWGDYALVARVMEAVYPRLVFVDAAWTSTYNANDPYWVEETDMLVASTDPVAASYYAAKYILTPIARYPSYTSPDYGRYATTLTRWTIYLADSAGFACTMDSSEMSVYDRRILIPQFTRIYDVPPVDDDGFSFGAGWVDYDKDEYLDLFVTNWMDVGQLNCLYHNEGDGTFTKVAGDIIVDEGGSLGSSWGDYDNDGDLDVFCANPGLSPPGARNYLYLNDGDGTFTKVTAGAIVNDITCSTTPAWADYDNDGDLDIFVGNHYSPVRLYRNDGEEFTRLDNLEIGLTEEEGNGSWGDCDGDGDLDLFITRPQLNTNALFKNDGDGTFTEVTSGDIVADSAIACSWGDYDNDGDLDIFATYGRNQTNLLYQNDGDGNFIRITGQDPVNDSGYWSGSSWGDYDNDGDLDLYVTGNYQYTPRLNALYENNGDGTFFKVTDEAIATDFESSAGAAWGDYDRDGDLDLFVANQNYEDNALYCNNGSGNNWINIRCIGTNSNRSAIGAKVRLLATIDGTPVWQQREVSGQTGMNAQNSLNAHFGLGDASLVDSVKVEWPSTMEQVLTDVSVNQFLTITEPLRGDANGDGEINVGDVVYIINFLYRGEDPPIPMETADANCDGIVDIGDVVYLLNYLYRGGPAPCEALA